MANTWSVDGTLLTEHLTREIEVADGLYGTSASLGENVQVAARPGTVWRPKRAGEGSFTLVMWIAGANPDGSIPSGLGPTSRAAYEQHLDMLLRIFRPYHRLLRFERTRNDGAVRECYGEVIARIEPAHLGAAVARLAVEVAVPGAFWQDTVDVVQELPVVAQNAVLRFTDFAAATAPMTGLRARLTGPINAPLLTVTDTGGWWSYNDETNPGVPAGETLEFNSETWAVTTTPTNWRGLKAVRFTGGYFLELPPDPAGPRITVAGSGSTGGITSATKLRLAGRRRYHL